jgi:hypothetical protein
MDARNQSVGMQMNGIWPFAPIGHWALELTPDPERLQIIAGAQTVWIR